MDGDLLIRVDHLWKKYSRDLRSSLRYGARDAVRELAGRSAHEALRRHEFWALQEVTLELHRGETLGILGANGAGKSTLLKLLHGVLKPTRGHVEIRGRMEALIELGGAFSPLLTGRENILVGGALLGLSRRQIEAQMDEIVAFAELEDFVDTPVGNYSTGMRARLGFAVATLIEPDILIIDEVLAVGDVRFQTKSLERIAEIRHRAGGVIFVSHNLSQIRRISTRCLLIDHGRVASEGEPESVIAAYLTRQQPRPGADQSSHEGPLRVIESWIEQGGRRVSGTLWPEAFRVCYHLASDLALDGLDLDVGLFNDAMQPVVMKMVPCPPLRLGEVLLTIDYPAMPLAPYQHYPYLAVNDRRTLRKLVKLLDPVGFVIEGQATLPTILDPPLEVRLNPVGQSGAEGTA